MPNYRRNYVPGGTYFFTLVTYRRRPFLTTPLARDCLRVAIGQEQAVRPFDLFAIVLLPDHLHAVWTLPDGDANYSTRWSRIKERFTRAYTGMDQSGATPERRRHGRRERAVWQPRFWEHTVRGEDDLTRCLDYLHYNPVKHGLADRVADYPWSTFARFVRLGEYEPGWGAGFVCPEIDGVEWD
ncbi:MAG: transposase [Gemmataceae bacterium]